ncbi:MAG: hypothetical protein CMG63_04590 [Candidatus Marinimicrobia bacterium]|nr:hypothetical protein [Candidatus Neomarinimicrobiota bacterium]|tara:strand:- start:670 stop:1164 length:495 start_codon:yes stop_codon:yes gene_type:complete
MKIRIYLKLLVPLLCIISGQTSSSENPLTGYEISSERYITDEFGNIKMRVNIWGHVASPGSHLVYDGIDLASLLSAVGGPKDGANFKKVTLYREKPDKNGNLVHTIDFDEFLKTGDRSNFIKIYPNDTIIIPQKLSNLLFKQIGTVNTIFSLVMIYLQIQYLAQ